MKQQHLWNISVYFFQLPNKQKTKLKIQDSYNTPLKHIPGNPTTQLWKDSLYSLLGQVEGCVPEVCWNNLRKKNTSCDSSSFLEGKWMDWTQPPNLDRLRPCHPPNWSPNHFRYLKWRNPRLYMNCMDTCLFKGIPPKIAENKVLDSSFLGAWTSWISP